VTNTKVPTTPPMPMIERRRIEANILKHVYETLKASHGKDIAQKTVGDAVRSASIQQGQEFAAKIDGNTSIATFAELQPLWTMEDALEITVLKQDARVMDFNVTRCRYAEMYRDMGLGEIGHLLSCQRDGTFCEGYDTRLKLTRTQTIMGGASHCDFRYRLEDDKTK
jgi:L-2-amino-thiazoline-4-carboxylic acid hydrolase